ncbi:MAG: nuclear transport factor 2 family protein [Bacteroidota bacterium]
MRIFLFLLLLSTSWLNVAKAFAQPAVTSDAVSIQDPTKVALLRTIMEYHQALVSGDEELIKLYTSKKLRYTHSNGWVETQMDILNNLRTGYLDYHSFKEDSFVVELPWQTVTISNGFTPPGYNKKMATVYFYAAIDLTMDGKRNTYHLKVAEIWKRRSKRLNEWQLIGRKATKI